MRKTSFVASKCHGAGLLFLFVLFHLLIILIIPHPWRPQSLKKKDETIAQLQRTCESIQDTRRRKDEATNLLKEEVGVGLGIGV